MKELSRIIMIQCFMILGFLLGGCLNSGNVDPIDPDNPLVIVDQVLLEELKPAFGDLGKKDARNFSAFYLALADSIEDGSLNLPTVSRVTSFGAAVRKKLDLKGSDYPIFKNRIEVILSKFSKEAVFEGDVKKDFCTEMKRLSAVLNAIGKR